MTSANNPGSNQYVNGLCLPTGHNIAIPLMLLIFLALAVDVYHTVLQCKVTIRTIFNQLGMVKLTTLVLKYLRKLIFEDTNSFGWGPGRMDTDDGRGMTGSILQHTRSNLFFCIYI